MVLLLLVSEKPQKFPPAASTHVSSMWTDSSSPDGVLDPELQSTGLSSLQPGEQAGKRPRPAVRLLLGVLLGHHDGPRDGSGQDWTGQEAWSGVLWPAESSNMDRWTSRC